MNDEILTKFIKSPGLLFNFWVFNGTEILFYLSARVEEELHPKLTNQLYVPSMNDGPDSLNAATFVSVVSF